ncbi:MAG: PUR family DNA/RNA-binding protein, partial [Bacteroidota bacterium]|nr:PUR family DNA/RNA-binding protein [Bacteroidota bacterium]MDX5429738.1 PUR family DNA/RNA-binding protein [Bacteroidota bacterium]MDX5468517.1 PUR family DNA/RNA-binding protein [Bacteroidota bacterium]
MEDYKNNDREEIFSKKIRAGKRTYFFDVKSTRANDFYITITESKKKQDSGMFVKHKIFL